MGPAPYRLREVLVRQVRTRWAVRAATRIEVAVRPFRKRYELRFDPVASRRLQDCIRRSLRRRRLRRRRHRRRRAAAAACLRARRGRDRPHGVREARLRGPVRGRDVLRRQPPGERRCTRRSSFACACSARSTARAYGLDITRAGLRGPSSRRSPRCGPARSRPACGRDASRPCPDLRLRERRPGEFSGVAGSRRPRCARRTARTRGFRTSRRGKAARRKLAARTRFAEWMTLMVRYSDNGFAGRVITALGYPYLNGVLRVMSSRRAAPGTTRQRRTSPRAPTRRRVCSPCWRGGICSAGPPLARLPATRSWLS